MAEPADSVGNRDDATGLTAMHRRRRKLFARARRARGNAAVEFALVFPLFIMLVLGIMETGRIYRVWHTIHFAVVEAARCASVNPTLCGTSAQIASYAAGQAIDLALPAGKTAANVFTVTTASCGTKVTATWPYQYVAVGLFPYSVTLTASACEVLGS
jgi:Flp pilus assembly protein TadG